MLFRRGSKILHIRFFLVFDVHGPCVQKYTRAPLSLLRGVLNIDFRKAQTERESSRRTSASRADLRLRELWGKESEAKEPKSVQ